jgi:hypothetical protein
MALICYNEEGLTGQNLDPRKDNRFEDSAQFKKEREVSVGYYSKY